MPARKPVERDESAGTFTLHPQVSELFFCFPDVDKAPSVVTALDFEGTLSGGYDWMTREELIRECMELGYESVHVLKKENPELYQEMDDLGILDSITGNLVRSILSFIRPCWKWDWKALSRTGKAGKGLRNKQRGTCA
jgi:hypothetical protein